jgi:ABC-type transport system involved in multi-copper enzyme maturation permease subunit
MGIPSFSNGVKLLTPRGWLGPHFYYDIIRLARKGWPTLARVLYLVALLVSLAVMYRTHSATRGVLIKPYEYAQYAQVYAYTLIILQNVLVLMLLPVYVASAIVEERENHTLEALTLTHLTDRELVVGKFGARVLHVGAIVLSSFPLLVFMHLWGNVDIAFLVYHEINTFLLLLSAGSLCIWLSAHADSVYQAVSRSFLWLAFLGIFAIIGALALPWMLSFTGTFGAPRYLLALPILLGIYGGFTWLALNEAVRLMEFQRRQERRGLRKSTAALALTDELPPALRAPGKRGQVRSRIHPWAREIGPDALFWKECIKDGSGWSLSARWLGRAFLFIVLAALLSHSFAALGLGGKSFVRNNAYAFSFTFYVLSLAAYALVVLFPMTTSIAGEREQGTLTFLLLIPEDRPTILRAKWLGPWWRNWPILAISYLGVLFGLGCGLYGLWTTLLLIVLPWPLLLMLGFLALWLSVVCRRVLFANIAVVALLGMLFIAHVAAGRQSGLILSFFITVIGETPFESAYQEGAWLPAFLWAGGEQLAFLLVAFLCARLAFRRFGNRDYATN